MALAKDVMGGDCSFLQAQMQREFGPVEGTATAAGTTQGGATAVTASRVRITSSAALAGVQAYNGIINDAQFFINDGTGNTTIVYPPTGNTINNLPVNTGVQLANNSCLILVKLTSTRHWAFVSA
jgi:hypothetical protein